MLSVCVCVFSVQIENRSFSFSENIMLETIFEYENVVCYYVSVADS